MLDGTILIEFADVPNGREGHGWIPALWINGRRVGSTYWPEGGDSDWAYDAAELRAKAEAARYVGDWNVTVRPLGQEE